MSLADNSLRNRAIPYRANCYDNQVFIGNQFVRDGTVTGDLNVIATGIGTGGQVRFLRPFKGDIISAKLTLIGLTPSSGTATLRVYKGNYAANGISLGTVPTEAEIAAAWKLITGLSAALSYGASDDVLIDGINILPLIPKRGDADFNDDGFVIGFDLNCSAGGAGWHLYDFKIDCNVRMATP